MCVLCGVVGCWGLTVDTSEEECIKAYFGRQQCGLCGGVSEWVDLPADGRIGGRAKLTQDILMP